MKKLLQTSLRPEVLKLIQRISTFRQTWQLTVNSTKDFFSSLKKTIIITSAGSSTRIEGAHLTDTQIIDRLKDTLKIQKITDRDEAEVQGYIDCLSYIFDHFEDIHVTEHQIRSLHQMMCSYLPNDVLPPDQRGAYKNITNTVVQIDHATGRQEIVFETTPPGPQTETAMRELFADYNNYINDPQFSELEVIAALIVKFLAIHPFRDGNGRISRLLTNLCLLHQGYQFCMYSSHDKVIEDNKDSYYIVLRQTQATLTEQADLNPWLIYFLRTINQQIDFLERKLPAQKPGTLTKLQDQVLTAIQRSQPVSIGFLERELKIKRITLKDILARFKNDGLIEMIGKGKGSHYKIKSGSENS